MKLRLESPSKAVLTVVESGHGGEEIKVGEFAPPGDLGTPFLHLEMSEQGAGPQVLEKSCRSVS